MTTDYRAMIAEMGDELDRCQQLLLDDRRQRHPLADRARAALAQPEPEGATPQPVDGEVAELVTWLRVRGQERETLHLPGAALSKQLRTAPFLLTRAADLLERLSPPQPVPVAERLPGPGDCDVKGRCWYGAPDRPGAVACWDLEYEPATDDTHWLPAHALPVPADD